MGVYRNIQKYREFLTLFVEPFEQYLKLINKLTEALEVDYIFDIMSMLDRLFRHYLAEYGAHSHCDIFFLNLCSFIYQVFNAPGKDDEAALSVENKINLLKGLLGIFKDHTIKNSLELLNQLLRLNEKLIFCLLEDQREIEPHGKLLNSILQADFYKGVMLFKHIAGVLNKSQLFNHTPANIQKAIVIHLYKNHNIDKVNRLLDAIYNSNLALGIADHFLNTSWTLKQEELIDDVITFMEKLKELEEPKMMSIYDSCVDLGFLKTQLKYLLVKYPVKELTYIINLIKMKDIPNVNLFVAFMKQNKKDSVADFIKEYDLLTKFDKSKAMRKCILLNCCAHGIEGASHFMKLVRELYIIKNVTTFNAMSETARHAFHNRYLVHSLLFHSCIKSVELHGFDGIDQLCSLIDRFKSRNGEFDIHMNKRVLIELCVYIVIYGCKNLARDFDFIIRNCLDELHEKYNQHSLLRTNMDKPLKTHGFFGQSSQNLSLDANPSNTSNQEEVPYLSEREQTDLTNLIQTRRNQIAQEHRDCIKKLFYMLNAGEPNIDIIFIPTEAQVEFLFLNKLQQLSLQANHFQQLREREIAMRALKIKEKKIYKPEDLNQVLLRETATIETSAPTVSQLPVDNSGLSVNENNDKNYLYTSEYEQNSILYLQILVSNNKQLTRKENMNTAVRLTKIIYAEFDDLRLSPKVADFIESFMGDNIKRQKQKMLSYLF